MCLLPSLEDIKKLGNIGLVIERGQQPHVPAFYSHENYPRCPLYTCVFGTQHPYGRFGEETVISPEGNALLIQAII